MRRRFCAFAAIAIGAALPGAAPAVAAGTQSIALVIQLGEGRGSIIELCIKEPPGTTGAQTLADALRSAGLAAPTYATSGLLCSIAGTPSTGCGVRAGSGYQYWAYFHGSSSGWTYAADGPGTHLASQSSVEGWRFERAGTGRPNDPAPDVSPDPSAVCAAAFSRTTSTTTTPASSPAPAEVPVESSQDGAMPAPGSTTTSSTRPTRPTTTTTLVRSVSSAGRSAAEQSSSAATTQSSPWGALGGVAVLAVLCGAGLLLWRKRSA